MTESPANDGGKGRKQGRFYKLVGGVVVGLVVAVALLPLLFGGGEGDEPRVVEVDPPLEEGATEPSSESREAASQPESSREGSAGEKWWRSDSGKTASAERAESKENAPAATEPPASSPEPAPRQTRSSQSQSPAQEPEPTTEPAPKEDEPAPEAPSGEGSATDAAEGGDGGETGSVAGEGGETGPEVGGPGWVVMTGSFRDASNARSLADRLEEQGFQAEVRTAQVKGNTWNRVLVGRADSRQGARELVPQLKEAGYSDLLVMEVQ
jgi:cell division septation protein DedD